MSIYRIADLDILINPLYEYTRNRLAPYISDNKHIDFEINITNDKILNFSQIQSNPCSPGIAESTLILNELCNRVLRDFDGFFFHSSSLKLDNEAYVFSAPSGTGKSTHTSLWRRHFGNRVTMINDDKPIIRKKDGVFYIYGTPWMGKSDIGNNIKSTVKAVYILQRGAKNSAVRVRTGEVFKQIFEATLVPSNRTVMSTLLSLLDEFFTSVPLFLLTCNTEEDAVTVAYNIAKESN